MTKCELVNEVIAESSLVLKSILILDVGKIDIGVPAWIPYLKKLFPVRSLLAKRRSKDSIFLKEDYEWSRRNKMSTPPKMADNPDVLDELDD